MKNKTILLPILASFLFIKTSFSQEAKEKNVYIKVEAESFKSQSKTEVRKWYKVSKKTTPPALQDHDKPHYSSASGGSYLEILPDTRITHDDLLIVDENFTNEGGKMAILHYPIKFATAGRYYVWVRAYSTGSEDNGLHVGLDGTWPEHGQRMQWCDGKDAWTWGSSQRTAEVHCGVPKQIYLDIEKPGKHEIQFSMREDGFEFDSFILTTDIEFIPKN
jgi:hypothetical protein